MSTNPNTPARILLVDDDLRNRQLLEIMLSPAGFRCEHAASGEEALTRIAEHPPDLVLLDVMMPGLDGYQVVGRLKSAPATVGIPVMIITAHDDRSARMRGLDAGADDFLSKPVDRAELVVRVRNLLRLKAYVDTARDDRMPDLAVSERVFRATFESAPVGMVHTDAAGQWQRVNQHVCDMLGYTREELRGAAVADLLKSTPDAGEAASLGQLAAGARKVLEKRYRHRDGAIIPVRACVSALRDADGNFQHLIWVLDDMTRR